MRMCPECKLPLKEITLHRERVDRCEKCRGLFLDKGELESIIEMVDIFEKVRLDEPEIPTVPRDEIERVVSCPDDGVHMKPTDIGCVVIDVCGECEGIWLDGGEIAALKLAENNIRDNLNLYIRLGR